MNYHLPEFASNRPRSAPPEAVGTQLSATFQVLARDLASPPSLSIATAYFNLGGYGLLADGLDAVGPVRLLLGSEPTDAQLRATITPLSVRDAHKGDPRVSEAVNAHRAALAEDRDLAGFGREVDAQAERLIAWLERGDIEVRRLEKGFLHGKAFIIHGAGSSVLAGSSNLTYAGLAVNHELNVGVYQPHTVGQVVDWFEEEWTAAEPFDLAGLYRARRVPHDPWLVYLRMLDALYGGDDLANDRKVDNELGLADFQIDGVWRAKRILAKRGGVIVADEVGLGKTYIAGELIREASIERRQKVLVIAPATLRDSTWKQFLDEKNLKATVVSFEELVAYLPTAGQAGSRLLSLSEYAMVVVDEAHHIRNGETARAEAMRALLGGAVGKDLLLLSATPVNNSLTDLHTLLGYINPSDSAFIDIGVSSLRAYFDRAMGLDPDELSGRHLFEVLDAVAVRRTRHFIKTQYQNALVAGKPIVFPQAVVHRVEYDLSGVLPGFFPRFAAALGFGLDDPPAGTAPPLGTYLTMARYVPSRYDRTKGEEQYETQNAGLLQSALLKRFESSVAAFAGTLRTMMRSHDHFLGALDSGWVLTGETLKGWVATDTDDVDAFVADLDDDARDNAAAATSYNVAALRRDVVADRALLAEFEAEVRAVHWRDDPKITALVDALAEVAATARAEGIGDDDTRNRRKVLLFTYFADTAEYLGEALRELVQEDPRLADYAGRIVVATGRDRGERQRAIVGFAPLTAGTGVEEDLFDLAIATDVLAEGVNLQQAGHIINYDLPWNPMRLVQRHGRVDRIGSTHSHIHLRCFFPDTELEELLNLEERLQRKLKQAAAAFGTGEVLPGQKVVDQVMAETREEIERLRQGDVSLFDDSRDASSSSEEFQRRLEVALRSAVTRDQVRSLPWGAGTGIVKKGAQAGVVFCIKVADHARPFFRFIPMDPVAAEDASLGVTVRPEDDDSRVNAHMLVSLNLADPGSPSTVADLPAAMHQAAFDAWPVAQRHVFDEWMARTDSRAVQPSVPKVMRDAAALVRKHGAALGEVQDRLVERFGQEVEARIQREVRAVLRGFVDDPVGGVEALRQLADDVRLPVPVPVQPLPEIELDDVRLLCWVAVHRG